MNLMMCKSNPDWAPMMSDVKRFSVVILWGGQDPEVDILVLLPLSAE